MDDKEKEKFIINPNDPKKNRKIVYYFNRSNQQKN